MPAPTRPAVSVPFPHLADLWPDLSADARPVDVHVWDVTGQAPADLDLVVAGFDPSGRRDALAGIPHLRWVQTLTAGYDGVPEDLPPGVGLLNGAGVHDAATAELALTLTLAALRDIPQAVRDADTHRWNPRTSLGLAGRRVLVVGAGHIGTAITHRLLPFDASVTRVGTRAREDALGPIHADSDLPDLLPAHDVVIVIVPLTERTSGMVDAPFLAAMPDGALLVNVARGPVVDTDALLSELNAGRLRAALDVTDPEPLPAQHPLWDAPGLLLTPHVGGLTADLDERFRRFLRAQFERLARGERPLNEVIAQTTGR